MKAALRILLAAAFGAVEFNRGIPPGLPVVDPIGSTKGSTKARKKGAGWTTAHVKRLAAGLLIERDDLVATLALLNDIERRMMKKTVREVKDAVIAEQIAIEIEQLGLKEAA